MSKTLLSMKKKNSEAFVAPKSCQDAIPIKRVYDDGIFQVGRELFSKTFKFTDINYAVADYDDKQNMLQEYADFLSTLDAGVPAKITINNRSLIRRPARTRWCRISISRCSYSRRPLKKLVPTSIVQELRSPLD